MSKRHVVQAKELNGEYTQALAADVSEHTAKRLLTVTVIKDGEYRHFFRVEAHGNPPFETNNLYDAIDAYNNA